MKNYNTPKIDFVNINHANVIATSNLGINSGKSVGSNAILGRDRYEDDEDEF